MAPPPHLIADIGWVFGFALPGCGLAFGIAWLFWRVTLHRRTLVTTGRVVGWKPVRVDPEWGMPDREHYHPIVEIKTHDGKVRRVTLTLAREAPVWSGPEPRIRYVLFPFFFAERGWIGFAGFPLGLTVICALTLAVNSCAFR